MEKLALQKLVAEKWLKATADLSTKKIQLTLDFLINHETHLQRLSTPPAVLQPFTSLIKEVINSGDSYRITYLGILLIRFYQGKELPTYLPGYWEDEADLCNCFERLFNN